jgi:hypothetical protein
MLAAWENGHVLEEVLGSTPPTAVPSHVTVDWLVHAFGAGVDAGAALQAALDLDILEPEGDGFRVTNRRLLRAASELAAAGVPLDALAEHGRALRRDVERIAARFVDLVEAHVFEPKAEVLPSPEEAARLTELAQRLRGLADLAVLGELGQAIDHETRKRLAAHLRRLLNTV